MVQLMQRHPRSGYFGKEQARSMNGHRYLARVQAVSNQLYGPLFHAPVWAAPARARAFWGTRDLCVISRSCSIAVYASFAGWGLFRGLSSVTPLVEAATLLGPGTKSAGAGIEASMRSHRPELVKR